MIHILIVRAEQLVGDLLAQVFNIQDEMQVTGQASTSSTALQALAYQACDVLLIDLSLDDENVRRLIATVVNKYAHVQCLVFGLTESEAVLLRYLETGAAGYLHMDDSLDDLIAKIRFAACGEALISPRIASALIARLVELKRVATATNGYGMVTPQEQASALTVREREVLALLEQGRTNRQIGEQLVITLGTVKNHVHNILDKLDVYSRKQAVMLARQMPADSA